MVTTRRRNTNHTDAPKKSKAAVVRSKKKTLSTKDEETPTVEVTNDKKSSSQPLSTSKAKTVTIEACKSWGAFKTRANKVLNGIGSKGKVVINATKPGKGNFVIHVEGVEEAVVELIGLKRPFPALKNLDMDEVIEKVVALL